MLVIWTLFSFTYIRARTVLVAAMYTCNKVYITYQHDTSKHSISVCHFITQEKRDEENSVTEIFRSE